MRGTRLIALCLVVISAGCSSSDDIAQPTTTAAPSSVPAETVAPDTAAVPTTAIPSDQSIAVGEELRQLKPGPWTIDLGTMRFEGSSDQAMDVRIIAPGELLLELSGSSPTSFQGFGVFELTNLVNATSGGVVLERVAPTADLGPWLASVDDLTLLDNGEDVLAGQPSQWWRFDTGDSCSSCFQSLFSAGRGEGSAVYGTGRGFSWQIWTVELDDRIIAVTLEAPTDDFQEFESQMQPLLASLRIETQAGESAWQTKDAQFASGRTELAMEDETRTTPAIAKVGSVGTEVQDSRTVLVSLLYPSDVGGWDAPPADGPFPLIILAPGLGDYGGVDPLDLRLAQSGYVVARVRYPGSSWPGELQAEINEQPLDTSMVLDALLGDALPPALAEAIDQDRIGMVGLSMGGTTVYGLLGADCCLDERIDAAVGHAPTTYAYNGELVFSDAPLLVVTSKADAFAPPSVVLAIQDLSPSTISSYVLDSGPHLSWVFPGSPNYEAMVGLTEAFLDAHVAGDDTSLLSMVSDFGDEWVPAQP